MNRPALAPLGSYRRSLARDFAYGDDSARASRPGNHAPAPLASLGVVLVGEREQRLYLLKPETIEYIEASGNYVKFYAGVHEYISRDSVVRLSTALAPSGFLRIERGLVVNVGAVSYVQRADRGTYTFTMASGACLRSGAKYRRQILRALPLQTSSARRRI